MSTSKKKKITELPLKSPSISRERARVKKANSLNVYQNKHGTHLPISEAGLHYFGKPVHYKWFSARFQSKLIRYGPSLFSTVCNVLLIITKQHHGWFMEEMDLQDVNKAIGTFISVTGLVYALIISNLLSRSLTRKADLEDAIGVEAMILKSLVTLLTTIDHRDNDIENVEKTANNKTDQNSEPTTPTHSFSPFELSLNENLGINCTETNENPLQDCFNILNIYGCRSLFECMGYSARNYNQKLAMHIRHYPEYHIHPLLMINALKTTGVIHPEKDKVLITTLIKMIGKSIGAREKRIRLLNNKFPMSIWFYILLLVICMYFGITYVQTGCDTFDKILAIITMITITGTLHIIADLQDALNGSLIASNEPLERFVQMMKPPLSNIGYTFHFDNDNYDSFVILRRQRRKSQTLFAMPTNINIQTDSGHD